MSESLTITLNWHSAHTFQAENSEGRQLVLSGKEAALPGIRPMELFLMSLASCSAIDVVHILQRGRKNLRSLSVHVRGERTEAVPAVFSEIHLDLLASGDFDQATLQRAVDLSLQKYCSVAQMLKDSVIIHSKCRLVLPEPTIRSQ